jgi:hypothetical protein
VDLLKIASTLVFWTSKMRGAGVSLMEKLGELEDPRRPSNGIRHDFREILVIAVCAMLSDADSFEDIALWGRLKVNWLRRFLVLENGIPSPDTFLRVCRTLDPKQFESVFRQNKVAVPLFFDESRMTGVLACPCDRPVKKYGTKCGGVRSEKKDADLRALTINRRHVQRRAKMAGAHSCLNMDRTRSRLP